MTEDVEVKSCGILLVCGEPIESFLLMKHADRWDVPKGHVDPGETELECAYRETEEETGISREQIELVPEFCSRQRYYVQYKRDKGRERLKELVIFLGRVPDDCQINVTEHLDYKWFRWNPPHQIQEQTIDPLLAEVAESLYK